MRGGADLYIIQTARTGDFKVGRSSNVAQRLAQLQTSCPYKLRILLEAPGLGHLERSVHRSLQSHRCRHGKGEWFREEGFGDIPVGIYNLISVELLEDIDWWKRR